jgi:para-nitrobenzyl esterase
MAANLFNKVINQSGNGRVNQAYGRYRKTTAGAPLPSAEEQGAAFAQQFGITDQGATGLAALRAVTARQLIDNPAIATFAGGSIIDGKLVPDEPENIYDRGQFTKVPIMLGTNSADLGFAKPAATKDEAYAVFGAGNLAAARAAFDPDDTATVNQVRSQIAAVITMH